MDQFDRYMATLLRERTANPVAYVGGGDAVHPGPIGHTVELTLDAPGQHF